jgi:hypothetical protein
MRDGITNSKRVARSSRKLWKRGEKGKHTYLSAGESKLAYRVARLSVAASASAPPTTASSVAAVVPVVVSISSPGTSAPSSQLSVDSSLDAAGVTRPLSVVVTPSMVLTFVVFFSLHEEREYLRTLCYAQLVRKLIGTDCRMTHLLRCCCHGYAQNVLSCRS